MKFYWNSVFMIVDTLNYCKVTEFSVKKWLIHLFFCKNDAFSINSSWFFKEKY